MNVHKQKGPLGVCLVTTALFGLISSVARAAPPSEEPSPRKETQSASKESQDDAGTENGKRELRRPRHKVAPGDFWIGVVCSPLDNEVLKTQLDLDQGIIVTQVIEGSPAQKAGLKTHDILVAADDEPLTGLKALVSSIEAAKETPLTLTLIRHGKRRTVEVQPTKRLGEETPDSPWFDHEGVKEWHRLRDILRQRGAVPQRDGDGFTFLMPGFILPDPAEDFPEELEVTITKSGQQKARITVKRGDKQWRVDADSLDELPDDIRPHVRTMLGKGPGVGIRIETDGAEWLEKLPKNLLPPRIIEKSLKITPESMRDLPHFDGHMRERIRQTLKETARTLENAKTDVPIEALKQIEKKLETLRKELEALREESNSTNNRPPSRP